MNNDIERRIESLDNLPSTVTIDKIRYKIKWQKFSDPIASEDETVGYNLNALDLTVLNRIFPRTIVELVEDQLHQGRSEIYLPMPYQNDRVAEAKRLLNSDTPYGPTLRSKLITAIALIAGMIIFDKILPLVTFMLFMLAGAIISSAIITNAQLNNLSIPKNNPYIEKINSLANEIQNARLVYLNEEENGLYRLAAQRQSPADPLFADLAKINRDRKALVENHQLLTGMQDFQLRSAIDNHSEQLSVETRQRWLRERAASDPVLSELISPLDQEPDRSQNYRNYPVPDNQNDNRI